MREKIKTIFQKNKRLVGNMIPAIVLAVVFIVLSGHAVHAQTTVPNPFNLFNLIADSLANFFYTLQTIASWLITLAGALLNFSINLTMHIKEFVAATPAIYTVWAAIRDLSGMFIIFALLYAAIMLITGYQDPKFGNLIKNIVMAGVLINFSFFITGLAIDASNVVSLQLYSALAPTNQQTTTATSKGDLADRIDSSIKNPGLSNIFMQSLGITRLYNPDSGAISKNADGSWSTPVKVIVIGVTSIIIMITAALSFFLASLAFIVRFVILLFLLAFSPIVFAAFIIPQLAYYSKKWTTQLKNQLIFMPVYLLLMYFALSVLTQSSIFNNGYAGSLTSAGGFQNDLLVLGVNATLVIIMMNIPLIAAMSLGAMMPKWAENVTAGAIWKKVGGFTGGMVGRSSVGWLGSELDRRLANSRIGNSSIGRDLRSVTTGAVANAKFGSSRSYVEQSKINEDVAKQRKLIEGGNTEMDKANKAAKRSSQLESVIASGTTSPIRYKDIISKMNEKEKLALGGKNLKNTEVLKHLKKSDFEAIKKSDDISDEDKAEIGKLRIQALREAIDGGISQSDYTEHMIKNMDTEDIMKLEDSYLGDPHLIAHLTAGQLKKMADEKLNPAVKKEIRDTITDWTTSATTLPISSGQPHHAFGFITKNRTQWS